MNCDRYQGSSLIFLIRRSPTDESGILLWTLSCALRFSSAAMQRFGIRVAEFRLDVLAMCFHRLAADSEFLRDLTGAVPSRDQCEHRHLAIPLPRDDQAGL